jgi:hypothetical protein
VVTRVVKWASAAVAINMRQGRNIVVGDAPSWREIARLGPCADLRPKLASTGPRGSRLPAELGRWLVGMKW